MRVRLAIALLACASCQQILGLHDLDRDAAPGTRDSPTAGDGPVVGDSGSRDAFRLADGAIDSDGDGVPDAQDNCPTVPNPDQHDWDRDGIGDACDHCPYLPDATDPDTDGDGVGDACDPRPTTPGDTRVLWEAFYDDVLGSGGSGGSGAWITDGGTWSVSGGQLHQTDVTANSAYADPPITVQRAFSAVQYHVDQVGTPNQPYIPSAGETAGGAMSPAQVYWCIAYNDGTNGFEALTNLSEGSGSAWGGSFAAGEVIRMTETLLGSNECNGYQGAVSSHQTSPLGATAGATGPFTGRSAVSFDYFFVVDMGSGS